MLTLYSYPELFGVADNNGYGLKVYAFLKLAGVPFVHEHIFDASAAPRGQLPYIVDDFEPIGDSETIIAHLVGKYRLTIDADLTPEQRIMNHLVTRMLDDLYWVMSYSRWKDERYFPAFRDAFMAQHSQIDVTGMNKARDYNAQRYYFQGIGRYTPDQAYGGGWPICRCSPIWFLPMAMCMVRSRPASMPASTASSPTSTPSRSRRR